jgi:hypothetical protein
MLAKSATEMPPISASIIFYSSDIIDRNSDVSCLVALDRFLARLRELLMLLRFYEELIEFFVVATVVAMSCLTLSLAFDESFIDLEGMLALPCFIKLLRS